MKLFTVSAVHVSTAKAGTVDVSLQFVTLERTSIVAAGNYTLIGCPAATRVSNRNEIISCAFVLPIRLVDVDTLNTPPYTVSIINDAITISMTRKNSFLKYLDPKH